MSTHEDTVIQTFTSCFERFQTVFQLNQNLDLMDESAESLDSSLAEVTIKEDSPLKMDLYDTLPKITKIVFAFKEQVTEIGKQKRWKIQGVLKRILLKISKLYSIIYCYYRMAGTGEIIKEFMTTQSLLFICRPSSKYYNEAFVKEQFNTSKNSEQYIWARKASFTSDLHRQCIEQIMKNLSSFSDKFAETRLTVIGEFFKLMYHLDDYIIQEKLFSFVCEQITRLETQFKNPSKQNMKDASKEVLDVISDFLIKILRISKIEALRARVQLLGPLLGISMMNLPSIQRKMAGAKIINRFSYDITYRTNHYLTELSFAQKLNQWRYFELVFQQNFQQSIVKCSDDGIKMLIRKGLFTEQKFITFFALIQKSSLQFRKILYRLIDPYRINYNQIQIMIKIFKSLRDISFYDEEFFPFFQALGRYSTHTQLKNLLSITQTILHQFYPKFKEYILKRKSIDCYNYIFDKLIYDKKTSQERIQQYMRVVESFLLEPCQFKLITLKYLMEGINDSKLDPFKVIELTKTIVQQKNFVSQSLILLKAKVNYQSDLIYFIKALLKKYRSFHEELVLNRDIFIDSVDYPQIFQELLALKQSKDCLKLLEDLSNLVSIKQVPFSCIRSTFYRLNLSFLKPIKKEYTDIIASYILNASPSNLIGLEILKYLLFNSKYDSIRKGCAELMSQLTIFYSDQMREAGEEFTIDFMKQTIQFIKIQYDQYKTTKDENLILGALTLIEQLMLTSEYFGVGSLRAHNSLIPTSMTKLKIYNNATHGDDVLKIFEKNIPSNWTLFEVIVEVSKQFKVGPLDVALQFPNDAILKYNGLTLEELKLNNHELNLLKLSQSRTKKAKILVNNEPTPQALEAFRKIFHKFAVKGMMSKKQCANYIQGATQHFCTSYDHRISVLFVQYDTDHDDQLTEENFVKFYTECLFDQEKYEAVEKNLANLRFRRDLKQYDEPIDDLNEETLFKFHICKNNDIYEMLFDLTQSEQTLIRESAERVLVRLPTYKKIVDELNCKISFQGKNSFQIQYILTAIQGFLNSKSEQSKSGDDSKKNGFSKLKQQQKPNLQPKTNPKQKFISLQNHLIISDLLNKLFAKTNKSSSQKQCLIVCLHILRSLVEIPHLKETSQSQILSNLIVLPKTDIFYQLIQKALENNDLTIFEPSLILQLTQDCLPEEWIENAIFNKEREVRSLTCNFLYYWQLKSRFSLNLYSMPSRIQNSQEMFKLLNQLIPIDDKVNIHDLFALKLKQLSNQTESLEGVRFNLIINGNLKLMKQFVHRVNEDERLKIDVLLTQLSESIISNQNRKIVYELRKNLNQDSLINYLIELSTIQPSKQVQLRNKYVGIKNLGSICYLNSILQQFYMIKSFKTLILTQQNQINLEQMRKQHNQITYIDDFLYQLQKMYCNLEFIQRKYYNPKQFCLTLKDYTGKPINTGIQQDAHQFLNTAFDRVETYLKKSNSVFQLENIFGGKTVTEIICKKCKNKIQKLEHFYHLSVQVKDKSSLIQSLNKFTEAQQISDYFCEICQEKVQKITKQTFIRDSPEILVINLQRITFDLETLLKVKVHTRLQFPFSFDLSNYVQNDEPNQYNYRLKGVVIHSGTSESGHYYSLIREEDDWYKFNDQTVSAFNLNEMGREAYGGNEQNDQWGDHISSTNAYILFYEKIKALNSHELTIQVKDIKQSKKFVQEVLQQNKLLYKQIQISQQSYFQIISELLAKNQPKNINESLTKEPYYSGKIENGEKMNKIFDIHVKIMKVLAVYYEIPSALINQIKHNIIKLVHLLPQKNIEFVESFKPKQMVEVLLNHNEPAIRQLYQGVLNKSLKVYSSFDHDHLKQAKTQQILKQFAECMKNQSIFKDPFKTFNYFDFWRNIDNYDNLFQMGTLLDILMGNQSPYANKEKKRQEFHFSQAKPITDIIIKLCQRKTNFSGYSIHQKQGHQLDVLTQKQVKILSSLNFYLKIIINRHQVLASKLIEFLSFNDVAFSKKITKFLVMGLNSKEVFDEKQPLIIIMLPFLLIKDKLQMDRFQWLLGIAQLQYINDCQFGLVTSGQSTSYNYISSLLFQANQNFMPLLHYAFNRRKYYNITSMTLNIALLELVNRSDAALTYILSMPAPVYQCRTFFDFMSEYIQGLKAEESYYLKEKKMYYLTQLEKLYQQYKEKQQKHPLYEKLPINKWIIGKNVELEQICDEEIQTEEVYCVLKIFLHRTYVLENKPDGKGNASLPPSVFSFGSTQRLSNYFVKRDFEVIPDLQLQTQQSMYSVKIKNSTLKKLIIKLPHFTHQIDIKSDPIINFPFIQGIPPTQIRKYIEIQAIPEQDDEQITVEVTAPKENIDTHKREYQQPGQQYKIGNSNNYSMQGEFFYEIQCQNCTYINVGRQRCEICENYLYK